MIECVRENEIRLEEVVYEPGNVLRLDKRKEVEGVRWAPNAIITDSA